MKNILPSLNTIWSSFVTKLSVLLIKMDAATGKIVPVSRKIRSAFFQTDTLHPQILAVQSKIVSASAGMDCAGDKTAALPGKAGPALFRMNGASIQVRVKAVILS